jgi:hypothetical protein
MSFREEVPEVAYHSGSYSDPTGKSLVIQLASGDVSTHSVFEMPARKMLFSRQGTGLPNAHGDLWLSGSCVLCRETGEAELVGLDPGGIASKRPGSITFTSRFGRLAVGNSDGTINLFDLGELQRRLAALNLE